MDFLKEAMEALEGDSAAMDKEMLGMAAGQYFQRMYQITGIIANMHSVDPELGEKMAKKMHPILELLTEHLDELIADYTKKHGEL